ncbi:solute carrier family 22 member 20 [Xenopus laevis]|uniref:Major facilitator superfamily (MFS) profile domain-containing protein n=2 Tax=Xenopus laevis TaxID=8355 RepID=A0A974D2L1_XENLA|nr:solute carrier family 22 member 20 [Xenopus laevis]OCT83983.1 hypothetical protein XELAEV_18022121mg [Xenopus laevis]
MGFNDLLLSVGGLGRFQIIHTTMLLIPMIFMSCHNFLQNFTAAIPAHRCWVPSLDNNTMGYDQNDLPAFIPVDESEKPMSCLRYRRTLYNMWTNGTLTNYTEPCEDGWVYDKSDFSSTIVTEWDLICKLRQMRQIAQSIYMAGVLVGAVVLGGVSDRFGRRAILIVANLAMAVCGTCAAFLPNFITYCTFRCLCGIAFSGIVLNSNSLILEWTPPKGRTVLGTLFTASFTCGQLLLAALAYGIREWRWLQFTVSAPFYFFFLYSWLVPESARWLILKGRSREALKYLRRVAIINGKRKEGEMLSQKILISHMQSEISQVKRSHSIFDLFRTPGMRKVTICLMMVWFSSGVAFYGIGMDLQNFGISIFLLQFTFGAIDLPAKLVAALLMTYAGRRVTQTTVLILAGVALLANAFIPQDMKILRMVLAVFGKGCMAASFACAYLFSGELFPTVIRQTGTGVVAMMARVGSVVAPLILLLWEISPILPSAIYGVTAIISGGAATFLMETRNQQLPESVEEVEARSRDKGTVKKISKEEVPLNQCESQKMVPKDEVPLNQSQSHSAPPKALMVDTV